MEITDIINEAYKSKQQCLTNLKLFREAKGRIKSHILPELDTPERVLFWESWCNDIIKAELKSIQLFNEAIEKWKQK